MATGKSTIEHLLDQFGADVSAKRMFGEYGLYINGVFFALVCDDQLFIKQTAAGRAFLKDVHEKPPYPGAKAAFLIRGDLWDDDRWLVKLAKVTAEELSLVSSKPKRRAAPRTQSPAKRRKTR